MMTRIFQILAILIITIGGLNAQSHQSSSTHNSGRQTTVLSNASKNNGNGNGQMVTICHQTGNGHITLTVNANALQAHLNHGDFVGTCSSTNNDDNDDDNGDDNDDDNGDDNNDDNGEDNDDDNGDDNNDDNGEDNDDDNDDDTAAGNDTTVTDTTITAPELPTPSPVTGCGIAEVISFIPGTTSDLLSPIDPARQILSNVYGSPEDNDTQTAPSNYNFVALGFGGEITVKFANPIHNGTGDDIYVVETTFGNNAQNCARYPEKIRAFASQDGCNWIYLGEGCQNTYFDLQGLAWAQYVKLIDISRIDFPYGTLADGYDLDGIVCLNGEEANPTPAALSADFATEAFDYLPGTMKNGGSIPAARSNKDNAVGAPQNTDVVNFVSLGFGGKISLKFDYVVFDKAGADLMLVETSFGNPSCDNYPETARIEVSLDNINWFMLENSFCLDQSIDIAGSGATMFQYIRISDASQMSNSHFPGTADGFDVDGVVVTQPGCTSTPTARIAATQANDNTITANEVAEISVYPNPFNDQLSINLSTSNNDEKFTVSIINTLGQVVSVENVEVAKSSSVRHMLPVATLSKGSYMISVRSANSNEVIRTVKF